LLQDITIQRIPQEVFNHNIMQAFVQAFAIGQGVLDFKVFKRYFTNNFYMSIISTRWKHRYWEEKID